MSNVKFAPMARRRYQCAKCGHIITTTTNHRSECWPLCEGRCRQIINPHTAKEVVLRTQTTHHYLGEAV